MRSNAPFHSLGGDHWPFEWTTDRDNPTIGGQPMPPVKWFITHSDYPTQIGAPEGGIKEIYQGSIDAAGIMVVLTGRDSRRGPL